MCKSIKRFVIVGMCLTFLITLGFTNINTVLAQKGVNKVEITTPYDNSEVSAKIGDIIKISLNENSSTGYAWQIADLPKQVVLSDEYVIDNNPDGLVGAPHIKVFEFMVKDDGVAKIKLKYSRSWESADDNDSFELIVRAKK